MTAQTLTVIACDLCGNPHEWPPIATSVHDGRRRAAADGWVFARAVGPARQIDLCPTCILNTDWDGRADRPLCTEELSTRPHWMSPDQYDPCYCILPYNHEGRHACEHT